MKRGYLCSDCACARRNSPFEFNEITRRVWARVFLMYNTLILLNFIFFNQPPKCRMDGYKFHVKDIKGNLKTINNSVYHGCFAFFSHTEHAYAKCETVRCRGHVAETDVQTACPLLRNTKSVQLTYGEHTNITKIKFPFKRKGLPSCSASLHVKAKKHTCASDFPTLPRFFVQTLNMIKHFIVNLKKTIVN